jgi:outer membrane protein
LTSKKFFLPGLTFFWFFALVSLAGAADTAGVVDSQKLLFQHPEFDAVAKHLMEMSRQKGSEIRFVLDGETDPAKRAEILKAANREIEKTEERLMAPIRKDCEEAIAAVMRKRKITIVLKKDAAYFGGADITEDVIAQLKTISEKLKTASENR